MDESPDQNLINLAREIALREAKYEDSLRRNKFLEGELLAAEEALMSLRQRLRSANRKGTEVEQYRSLLHQLRSRWYLRPLIPSRMLARPAPEDDPWKFCGPRFGPFPDCTGRSRKRVLVVGHLLSAMLFGGETSLLDTIFAIDPVRFDIFVVFPETNDLIFKNLQSQVQGIAVLDYRWWRVGREVPEQTINAFGTLLREQAIDLVHVNTIMIREPLIAAQRLNLPTITNARELISLDDELAARLGGTPAQIVREVCRNTTYLLANSAVTLADYPCGERGGFLYNCVDHRALDLPNPVDPRRIHVGLVSSNLRKKGVLDFLTLARLTADVLPQLQFHLIGPENNLIKEWRAGAERLPDNVCLRGYVSPASEAYRELNLVLNLSRFAESFGRTVAEAMAARRPVIAYRHGALPELIDDGETGFLVPFLDLQAVLDRLRFFVDNPKKITEFGEAARQRSLQRFSRADFGRRLNALYERLIAEAHPNR